MSTVQIQFSKSLMDAAQTPSCQIIEDPVGSGQYKLQLTLGLVTSTGSKVTHREAMLNTELYASATTANIALAKITGPAADNPSSTLSIVFNGTLNTKLPGTGPSFVLYDFDKNPII